MKKFLFLLIFILLVFSLTGCQIFENKSLTLKERVEEETLSFKIEKIVLSKGFQSTDPNVEILKKGNNLKIMASLGIVESAGVTVDKITKSNNSINIYIDRLLDDDKAQLAIPQIMIEIQSPIEEKYEDLNFNIVNQNYEPIHLKFNKKQILNNIYSQHKIATNNVPNVSLTQPNDNIIWNLDFQNIYDKENYKSPLINFNVKVDALTGKIIDSKKINISSYIDDGHLLDYIPNKYILYKKQESNKDGDFEILWTYDIKSKEKNKIYTSTNKIQNALFSPKNNYIAILEINDKKSDLYMVPREDKLVYKITPANYLNPRLMKWESDNNLCFVNIGENRSTLLSYNVVENQHKSIFTMDFRVEDFDILDGNFIFVQEEKEAVNNKIFISKNASDLEEINMGFKPKFYNGNTIIYLKNIEKEDKNILQIYNIENKEIRGLDYDTSNYFLLNNENIVFIEKNSCNNDYTLYRYNVPNDYILPIANVNSDKIYYDQTNNIGYIALNPPLEDNKNPIIYSVDLGKLGP
ncbi:MAG: hypothetical protein GX968_06800 [Tissierellia bacterium]|nr:hypothetical protein [Tissierellia bacterium]